MYITNFNYHKPESIDEALITLNTVKSPVALAGGTDLFVEMKKGIKKVDNLVSLSALVELKEIKEYDHYYSIGAGATIADLASSDMVKKNIPSLADTAKKIASHQIRNTATLGGNLCTAASCADTAPILIALNGLVELHSVDSVRTLPLNDFFISHHKTAIQENELMMRVIIPKSEWAVNAAFEKFGLRDAASISVASVSVALYFDDNFCKNARIVVGACSATPKWCETSSDMLINKTKDEIKGAELINAVCEATSADTKPIDDIRGTADYRKHLVKVLTKSAIERCMLI
ncbi:MAG: xanthine dehydrogenase family protein subunit M [Candidatus Kapabacteria bacterium]|nr:xanthine dehydrogenase family protein subunit M [Candidatus Kapabacteria bacterium]